MSPIGSYTPKRLARLLIFLGVYSTDEVEKAVVEEWASDDDGAAAVELLRQSRTVVVVGQGDDRVTIDDAGTVTEA
jgi:hypothetical protein